MVSAPNLRTYYAHLIAGKAGTSDQKLIDAFATVERERFVGNGPWKVNCNAGCYVDTPSDDLAFLYQDVVVALVPDRGLNNGEPSWHARCLAALDVRGGERAIHVGSGTGYYTAILAQLIGPKGAVVAYEIDRDLARRAAANLETWRYVSVQGRSATDGALPASDIIYASAGATRPPDTWLEALRPGGRLLFPLTPSVGLGGMLLVTRLSDTALGARFVQPVAVIACEGARNREEGDALGSAFARGNWSNVKSLRRGNPPDDSSWFTGDGWWLSTRENA
jgi:protein-L-isoaspartate(D-aspartate) O-methyltransferase